MAGGGGVSTGGGLLVKGGVYGIVRLGNDLGLSLEGAYAWAPDGNFRAAAGIDSAWSGRSTGRRAAALPARPARTDFSAGGERYDAPRSDGSERALGAVALKLDRYLTPNLYITGKVLAAASGGASGYTSALVGAGWHAAARRRACTSAPSCSPGAGGGGGVVGDGALVEPRVFVGVQITPTLGLRAGAGRIKAIDGPLSSNVFDLSLDARLRRLVGPLGGRRRTAAGGIVYRARLSGADDGRRQDRAAATSRAH